MDERLKKIIIKSKIIETDLIFKYTINYKDEGKIKRVNLKKIYKCNLI